MKSCKRCLYTTSHPLGLTLNSEGVCSGCQYHDEKNSLDWGSRLSLLKTIVSEYKSTDSKTYDCIVPVSGAYDSFFIMHVVTNILGLKPLMVTYNKYYNTPLGIRNLAKLRSTFNCDLLIQNVNYAAVKRITSETLRRLGSVYWHCIAGQTVFPVQTAVRYKIPLIIWGAHQGNEQVGMFSHTHEVEMTRRYRKDHDLMGLEADDLLTPFNTLKESDIHQYRYPTDASLDTIGVRGIYLGNYIRWDPKAQHELMIKLYRYESCKFSRTFDTYDFVDSFVYMNLHDELKLAKHGYSKVTDHASREIRHGRLDRPAAQRLVQHYQIQPSHFNDLFSRWLNIPDATLSFIIDQHKSPEFWDQKKPGRYSLKTDNRSVNTEASTDINYVLGKLSFQATSNLCELDSRSYITFGKGYPN